MADLVPRSIDRAALERIIMRAAELQTADRDIGDNLSWDEVRDLGKDVGIPERFMQQALLEEQNRTPATTVSGLSNRLVGPATVTAERVVQGTPRAIDKALLGWIEEQELLTVQRHQPGRIDWEPLPGLQVAFKRSSAAFGGGRKPFMLAKAGLVTAIVTELEAGYCHVQIRASLGKERNEHLGAGTLFLGGGAVGTGVMISSGAMLVLMPIPLIAGAALATLIWRTYRPHAERTRLGLERALDHLERGTVKPGHQLPERSPSLLKLAAEEIRKALGP
jgi:hypothetical protein